MHLDTGQKSWRKEWAVKRRDERGALALGARELGLGRIGARALGLGLEVRGGNLPPLNAFFRGCGGSAHFFFQLIFLRKRDCARKKKGNPEKTAAKFC